MDDVVGRVPWNGAARDAPWPPAHLTNVIDQPRFAFAIMQVVPKKEVYTFRTKRQVPKVGLMLVGWGGNNGTTTTAGAYTSPSHGPAFCQQDVGMPNLAHGM